MGEFRLRLILERLEQAESCNCGASMGIGVTVSLIFLDKTLKHVTKHVMNSDIFCVKHTMYKEL